MVRFLVKPNLPRISNRGVRVSSAGNREAGAERPLARYQIVRGHIGATWSCGADPRYGPDQPGRSPLRIGLSGTSHGSEQLGPGLIDRGQDRAAQDRSAADAGRHRLRGGRADPALARPATTALARATTSAWPPHAARSGRTDSPARSMIRSWSRWCRPPTWPSARSRGGWVPGFRGRASAGSAPRRRHSAPLPGQTGPLPGAMWPPTERPGPAARPQPRCFALACR